MDPHNPRYGEPGAIYGQVYYSAGASENQQTRKPKPMSEIKLATSHMNPAERIDFAEKILPLLAPDPPKTPPIPNMATPVADLTAKLAPAKAANDAYEQAKLLLPSLKTARDTTSDALGDELDLVAKAAAKESKGSAELLQAVGFEIAATTHSPAPPVEQVQNLTLSEGKMPGSVGATCDPDPNASTYEWQTTTGDSLNGPYVTFKLTTPAHVTITGLVSAWACMDERHSVTMRSWQLLHSADE